jgi:hypothetical protein
MHLFDRTREQDRSARVRLRSVQRQSSDVPRRAGPAKPPQLDVAAAKLHVNIAVEPLPCFREHLFGADALKCHVAMALL